MVFFGLGFGLNLIGISFGSLLSVRAGVIVYQSFLPFGSPSNKDGWLDDDADDDDDICSTTIDPTFLTPLAKLAVL